MLTTLKMYQLAFVAISMTHTQILSTQHNSTMMIVHKCMRESTIVINVIFTLETKGAHPSTVSGVTKLALPTQPVVTIFNHTGKSKVIIHALSKMLI
jgi:hypothetical protein